jgi:hypothetical protein
MIENKGASITDHESASCKKGIGNVLTGMSVPLDRRLLMGDPPGFHKSRAFFLAHALPYNGIQ